MWKALWRDTGWVPFDVSSLPSGWDLPSATELPPKARLSPSGDGVFLSGRLRNAGFESTTFTTVLTLPTGIPAPAQEWAYEMGAKNTTKNLNRSVQVTTGGEVRMISSAGSGSWFAIDTYYPVG